MTPPPAAERPPWWLWPNLLAFDAPAVAAAWQRFLGHVFAAEVPAAATACLALVVWCVYLLDRRLDARPGRRVEPGARHRFAARNATLLEVLAAAAFVGAAAAATQLSTDILYGGAAVAFGVAVYLAAVHLARLADGVRAKEFSVGVLFAAGVAVPLFAQFWVELPAFAALVAFAAVCWLNCRLIDRWEAGARLETGSLIAFALALAPAVLSPPAFVAAGGSAALLLALNALRHRLGGDFLRIAADAALLVPLGPALLIGRP